MLKGIHGLASLYSHLQFFSEYSPMCSALTSYLLVVFFFLPVGFEYRCYPFQTDLVLPFLPKPRAERVRSTGIENGGNACQRSV